jgi:mono/diheme cytochrome c family protein
MSFEHRSPTEDADIEEIARSILTVQARYAAEQHRSLGRGTHTKGICVRATFEIFDIRSITGDATLAGRLGRGLFARPGVYPATARFANAASTVQPDRTPDVRALSFAVHVPPGVLGPDETRLDFSMNNAPTFPINDAHAFATFMRVQAADGRGAMARAFFRLPFSDKRGFIGTAVRGVRQQRRPLRPYQQTRYWSTVPFLHGEDEVIKYSAMPSPTNPAQPPGTGPDALRDELIRHLTEDPQPASFDFAIQLLDTERMTWKGGRRDAAFWVENASVEWPESQAPFHVAGRLTLVRGQVLPDEVCRAFYIDVTEHALPEGRPLGSINRARWRSESASREARLGLAALPAPAGAAPMIESSPPPPDPSPSASRARPLAAARRRIGGITLRTMVRAAALLVLLFAGIVAALSLATIIYTSNDGGMLPPEPVHELVYLDQGWGAGRDAADRQTYYYTAQGAGLKDLRYSWFVHLEMPWGRRRIADPDVLRRYGFVVDGPSPANPDGLPVGFSKHFDREVNEELLDITCAACHTGEINVTRNGRTTAIRIDGGSALHAFTDAKFGHFVPTLVSSMVSTATNPFKFNRFARRVLGEQHPAGRRRLHRELRAVIAGFGAMAYNEWRYKLVPTEEGYGRTDALARIANTVFADHLDEVNYHPGNAPVNYPPVWNIWKFDWVQYNASVSQPMARNIGEAMGTGAKYALINRYGGPLPPEQRFRSSALLENLHTIEVTLRGLQPPVWREDILGPIDHAKAERGKELFNQHCVSCHGPFVAPPEIKARNAPLKTDDDPEWIVRTICADQIGTDPNTAENFARATVDLRKTGLTADDLRRVARENYTRWNQRQAAYLTSEIARLRAALESPAPDDPDPGAVRARIDSLERERDGLDDVMERRLAALDPARIPVGLGLSYLGTMIREKAYADRRYTPEEQAELDGFGMLDMPQVIAAYKPRPLAGIWATPPFLHNGSVPTIYDLLSPVEERPTTFRVGSREFDPVKLGLAPPESGFWVFDTTQDGNRNTGHEFSRNYTERHPDEPPRDGIVGPYLEPEDRYAIIEHLKVRNDDLDGPQEPRVPPSSSCPVPPARR